MTSHSLTRSARGRELTRSELVRLILAYHQAHIRDLSAAVDLAFKVEARHGADPEFPRGLTRHIETMLEDLAAHQMREEELFPTIFEEAGSMVAFPAAVLSADHDAAQDHLEGLVRLTKDYCPPSHACASWKALYDLCRKYDGEFREHVRLEERVFFQGLR